MNVEQAKKCKAGGFVSQPKSPTVLFSISRKHAVTFKMLFEILNWMNVGHVIGARQASASYSNLKVELRKSGATFGTSREFSSYSHFDIASFAFLSKIEKKKYS